MVELERELSVLGSYVELPGERDLWQGIAARLERRPSRRRLRLVALNDGLPVYISCDDSTVRRRYIIALGQLCFLRKCAIHS